MKEWKLCFINWPHIWIQSWIITSCFKFKHSVIHVCKSRSITYITRMKDDVSCSQMQWKLSTETTWIIHVSAATRSFSLNQNVKVTLSVKRKEEKTTADVRSIHHPCFIPACSSLGFSHRQQGLSPRIIQPRIKCILQRKESTKSSAAAASVTCSTFSALKKSQ